MPEISYNSSNPEIGLFDYIDTLSGNHFDYLRYEYTNGVTNPEQLFYYKAGNSYFTGYDGDNQYVGFFLKKHSFVIKSYYIQTSHNNPDFPLHPTNWSIKGSYDGITWKIIDAHTNDTRFLGSANDDILTTNESIVRYLRFELPRQFSMRYLEFFGYITNAVLHVKTCYVGANYTYNMKSIFVFIFLLNE